MRRYILIMTALLILAIEFAARPSARLPRISIDPAAGIEAEAAVPASVMSTLRRACFDCHSDETRWPWYSALPIASRLIDHDVKAGRGVLNFSRWTQYNRFDRADLLDKACELATKRDMPLRQYRLIHREARLGEADIAALCAWSGHEAARLVGEGR